MPYNPYIAIVTTTYNMANTIYRTYESILSQTYKKFYWLIVDNGSTDNTKDVIDNIVKTADIKIQYIYKDHGIRATAINTFIENVEGDLVVEIHADDKLFPDSLQIFVNAWNNIPINRRDMYFNICSHCTYSDGCSIVGELFPANCNNEKISKKLAMNTKGEKHYCLNTKILKEFSIPIFNSNVSYIFESILWMQMQRKYRTYFINEFTRLYFDDNDKSFSNKKLTRNYYFDLYISNLYLINNIFLHDKSPYLVWQKYLLFTIYQGFMCGKKFVDLYQDILCPIDKVVICLFSLPIKIYSFIKLSKIKKD